MKKVDLLSRMFCAAADPHGNPCRAEDKLSTLYRTLDGTVTADHALEEELDRLNLPEPTLNNISDRLMEVMHIRECQGFVNGVRYGVLLARELGAGGDPLE